MPAIFNISIPVITDDFKNKNLEAKAFKNAKL